MVVLAILEKALEAVFELRSCHRFGLQGWATERGAIDYEVYARLVVDAGFADSPVLNMAEAEGFT